LHRFDRLRLSSPTDDGLYCAHDVPEFYCRSKRVVSGRRRPFPKQARFCCGVRRRAAIANPSRHLGESFQRAIESMDSYTTRRSRNKLTGMAHPLTLRIVIEGAPPGIDYALQKGRGKAYETVQTQRSAGQALVFEFQPTVRNAAETGGAALGGPFVQGPPDGRFVYIGIGRYAGQADSCWSGRLKIPLNNITAQMLAHAGVLEARIQGTAPDGSPRCATVKQFEGWNKTGL
jgi:hypothetical protein